LLLFVLLANAGDAGAADVGAVVADVVVVVVVASGDKFVNIVMAEESKVAVVDAGTRPYGALLTTFCQNKMQNARSSFYFVAVAAAVAVAAVAVAMAGRSCDTVSYVGLRGNAFS
jgi:hypothetical protein